jgi:hypothetical protein
MNNATEPPSHPQQQERGTSGAPFLFYLFSGKRIDKDPPVSAGSRFFRGSQSLRQFSRIIDGQEDQFPFCDPHSAQHPFKTGDRPFYSIEMSAALFIKDSYSTFTFQLPCSLGFFKVCGKG